jgi:hypothetical protein
MDAGEFGIEFQTVAILAVLFQEAVQHALAAGLVNDEVVVILVIIKTGQIVH